MNYIELEIPTTDSEQSEIAMAFLSDLPFESFETGESSLKAYIRKSDLEFCIPKVDKILKDNGLSGKYTEIETINWNKEWESNFNPISVEGKCFIRAPFHDPDPGAELDIVIMPKMSFGTGHHATTYLMVSEILRHDLGGLRGLDMGCGTGILAIVAAKRGAAHTTAVDIDEWAIENCSENIVVNQVQDMVLPLRGDVSAIAGKKYDFILANINRNILLADMGNYCSALNEGGTLIMSGIFDTDVPNVSDAAVSLGIEVTGSRSKDGWAVITCRK